MEEVLHLCIELKNPYAKFVKKMMYKWKVSEDEVIRMSLRGWMIDLEENEISNCELVEEFIKTKLEAIPLKDLPFN